MKIPEGWKLVPTKLTAENGMKAALIGEFHVPFPELDEDGNEHIRKVNVPWTVIKKIHQAMIAAAPTPPAPEVEPFHHKPASPEDMAVYQSIADNYAKDAPEVEPVAWHVKRAAFKQYNNGGEFYGRDEAFFNAGFDAGYAHHPANDGLRNAARQYLKSCDHGNADERRRDLENLRAELNK
ncbi:hypothetical protein SAMN06298226_1640 [Nitrosovibrio sp. Nv4]|nr:hypothetical protein SAMN06298226_1640 [Nitrosovibrio sp. Nv4]